MTCYPTVEDVLQAHSLLIARFGGSDGLRDRGALEAALARPQSGYYEDIIQEAAALWESLSLAPVHRRQQARVDYDHSRFPAGKRVSSAIRRFDGVRFLDRFA